MKAILQYFSWASTAIIRKGAVMSEKDARRNRIFSVIGPFMFLMFLSIEMFEPSETLIMKCIVWWLIGMMALSSIVLPMTLYGYHNRDRINTEGDEPLDYGPGMRGALLGTALVPLGRLLFDYFGIS